MHILYSKYYNQIGYFIEDFIPGQVYFFKAVLKMLTPYI